MSIDIRVSWVVRVWGPRAADNVEHSLVGTGSTPAQAIADALESATEKQELIGAFLAALEKEKG